MNRFLAGAFANRTVPGAARCLLLMRAIVRTAARYVVDRKAARRTKVEQRCSEMKLTDEMERKIAQAFMQNHNFRL